MIKSHQSFPIPSLASIPYPLFHYVTACLDLALALARVAFAFAFSIRIPKSSRKSIASAGEEPSRTQHPSIYMYGQVPNGDVFNPPPNPPFFQNAPCFRKHPGLCSSMRSTCRGGLTDRGAAPGSQLWADSA